MPRTPEQNQNIKDKRRSKLLLFALKAFAVNGYDHTAVDDITRPAKCSHGLFYHYFSSKEVAFDAIVDEVLTKDAEFPVEEALLLGGTKGLRLIIDFAGEMAKTGPRGLCAAYVTLMLGESKNLSDKGKAFFAKHDVRSALVTLIRQGQQEGNVIAGDPEEIALAVYDMAEGSFWRLNDNPNAPVLSADVIYGLLLKKPIEE